MDTNGNLYAEKTISMPSDLHVSSRIKPCTNLKCINFSNTENPLGKPASLKHIVENITQQSKPAHSSSKRAQMMDAMLSAKFNLPENCFLVGPTIRDMICLAAQAYEPCNVGVAVPTPIEHERAIQNAGHQVVHIANRKSLVMPPPSRARRKGVQFDAVVLGNPSYPTSRLLPMPTLRAYLKTSKWVIVDERSIELTLGGESTINLIMQYPNLIVVRSFIETFAIQEIPVSYCIAHPDTIACIARNYDSSCVSTFAEELCSSVTNAQEYLERTRDLLAAEIPWLHTMLDLIPGITVFPAEANYIMCLYEVPSDQSLGVANADELCSRLEQSGLLVRKLEGMYGLDSRFFVVCPQSHEENEQLISTMRTIILSDK